MLENLKGSLTIDQFLTLNRDFPLNYKDTEKRLDASFRYVKVACAIMVYGWTQEQAGAQINVGKQRAGTMFRKYLRLNRDELKEKYKLQGWA